jgi:hypothetical protein
LSFGTKAGSYDRDAEMRPTGQIDARRMQVAIDGSFEILVSRNATRTGSDEESSRASCARPSMCAVAPAYEIECLNQSIESTPMPRSALDRTGLGRARRS